MPSPTLGRPAAVRVPRDVPIVRFIQGVITLESCLRDAFRQAQTNIEAAAQEPPTARSSEPHPRCSERTTAPRLFWDEPAP